MMSLLVFFLLIDLTEVKLEMKGRKLMNTELFIETLTRLLEEQMSEESKEEK